MALLESLFGDRGLTPHGFCLAWDPELVGLHVGSDMLIGLAYYSIPLTLGWFAMRRRDLVFRGVFWLFVAFIMACGTTHFMSVWTLWHPDYATEGMVKAVTAALSLMTAVELWPLLPRALALPSPAELRAANEELRRQVQEREAAVAALQRETAERLRAEAMLHQAQKMEAIGMLTGGIAHDFNNLLTVIVTNLEMLDRRLAQPEQDLRKFIDRSMRGAARGAALTQQLLAYARQQPLQPEAVDVARLVAGTAELLNGTLGREIILETDLQPGLWPVEVDPNQLETTLVNLAINSRDAMPAGGQLCIAARNVTLNGETWDGEAPAVPDQATPSSGQGEPVSGQFVAISVADTGTGMPPDVRAAAFEPFFTTKPVGQGSGLGLSQVWGFVKQSSGHVTLQSSPGQGTVVTIYLRRAEVEAVADRPDRAAGLEHPRTPRAFGLPGRGPVHPIA